MDEEFDTLVGKHILSIDVSEASIRFNMQGKSVVFDAYGDCCSSSFIESLDNPEVFEDAIFDSVESVDGEQKEVMEGEEEDFKYYRTHKWTFYKFKTSKGMCTLSFRNESNGYYNGYLVLGAGD